MPVYDVDATLIAEPDPAARVAIANLPRPGFCWRLQFNLQSLLLLAVVASCAASCYGIHYRRAQPQRAAVAQYDKFHPQVYEMGDDVWWLDFSACTLKPGDDDLVHLKELPNLESLCLEGSPITDAGLKHLYPLKKLTFVTLSNTKVTQKGVDVLRRVLPKAHISWYSPTPPIAPVPPPAALSPVGRKIEDFAAMELLCALLTGFFLWLLVYQWRRKSIARMRRLAGGHVFTAGSTVARTLRWTFLALSCYPCLLLLASMSHVSNLGNQFGLAMIVAVILMLGIPRTRNIALEVREHGVLFGVGINFRWREGLQFVPWNQIAAGQWVPKRSGEILRLEGARNCLTIGENAVPPEQRADVTAAVGQFVPVYDQNGAVAAKPDEQHCDAVSVSWRDLDPPRFQFDLQTLLLFAVVVACAASQFGLYYRSPRHQAILRLAAFNPKIHYRDGDVWALDFSGCAKKPTDDDLIYLQPLAELSTLDLSGAADHGRGVGALEGAQEAVARQPGEHGRD